MTVTHLSLSVNNLNDVQLYADAVEQSQLEQPLPFVEILWDNYCHLEPEKILEYLSQFSDRVALHIMWSRFLERDQEEFEAFLNHLQHHVNIIQPVYISDHLCQFSLNNVALYKGIELDYLNMDLELVRDRVQQYQESIGRQLLLENFASEDSKGKEQVEFIAELIAETNCGLLFDISNAIVAEKNNILSMSEWFPLFAYLDSLHCHVGSYSYHEKESCYYDTHDSNLSRETLDDIKTISTSFHINTLCYEREHHRTSADMANDMNQLFQQYVMPKVSCLSNA